MRRRRGQLQVEPNCLVRSRGVPARADEVHLGVFIASRLSSLEYLICSFVDFKLQPTNTSLIQAFLSTKKACNPLRYTLLAVFLYVKEIQSMVVPEAGCHAVADKTGPSGPGTQHRHTDSEFPAQAPSREDKGTYGLKRG